MTGYAKIAISLPQNDLADLDRLAAELDRPRSWVVAHAVRRLIADHRDAGEHRLDPQRRVQVRRDLALTAEERVRAADELLVVGSADLLGRPQQDTPHHTPQQRFATYDEFAIWRRQHGIR